MTARQTPAALRRPFLLGIVIPASVLGVGLLVGLGLVLRFLVLETRHIGWGGMYPTMRTHDFIGVNKLTYRFAPPVVGDAVFFPRPSGDIVTFGRIIGQAGDVIELRGDTVWRNGVELPRRALATGPCEQADPCDPSPRTCRHFEETLAGRTYGVAYDREATEPAERRSITVPTGHVFVLGDNRDATIDSRDFGVVPVATLHGRLAYRAGTDGAFHTIKCPVRASCGE